jgi:hypothetical protein
MRTSLALALAVLSLAAPAAADPALPDAERRLIEAMITAVEQLGSARFVRNGKEYSASDAAKFLRRKWESHADEVRTAEDFIAKVGSFSSTSGKPYVIRYPNWHEQQSADFLKARLAELKGAPTTYLQPNLTRDDGAPLYLHFRESDMPLRVAIAKPAVPAKYGSRAKTRDVAIEAMRLWETALRPRAPWFRLEFVEDDPKAPVQIVWKRRLTGSYSGFGGIGYDVADGALRIRGEMQLSTTPGSVAPPLTIDDIRIVVAHEFGHVLGLMHCHACDSAMSYAWDTRDQVIVTETDVATFLALSAQPLPEPQSLR